MCNLLASERRERDVSRVVGVACVGVGRTVKRAKFLRQTPSRPRPLSAHLQFLHATIPLSPSLLARLSAMLPETR